MPAFLPLLQDLAGPSPAGIAPQPDTHVYQLRADINEAALVGATTAMPPGQQMRDVYADLRSTPYDTSIPTSVARTLRHGPALTASIGSSLDIALSSFSTLVELVASYKKGADLSPIEGSPTALPATSGVVVSGAAEYIGYTVRETSGSAVARVVLRDSITAGAGAFLEEITLSAGESASDEYNRPGRLVTVGIYATIVGAVEGSVFT